MYRDLPLQAQHQHSPHQMITVPTLKMIQLHPYHSGIGKKKFKNDSKDIESASSDIHGHLLLTDTIAITTTYSPNSEHSNDHLI